ncbi:hypothetical protein BCR35DRAFT_315571 [Leucosporidium creatinivorum]|uniref:BTB domain-containing protein n=1 Tax=Leucosporidium creatinivorum TaxID=106004 RepID=A0A1Y2DU75_9BASI|nr:hypothetical protein BCR35DRAFT_315571 [Leucosporidium creatinivorum]
MSTSNSCPVKRTKESSEESRSPGNRSPLKRFKPAEEGDCEVVSSDGVRFKVLSRLLLSSSESWGLPSPTEAVKDQLPVVEVKEDSETLDYILQFLYPQPVSTRGLEFPRDWKVIRAFEKYSIWRGLDAVSAAFSKGGCKEYPAYAYAFARHFNFPSLASEAVAEASARETPIADIGPDLSRVTAELPISAESITLLLGFLSTRQEHLIQGRLAATQLLRAFDTEYDCEHSCTGMKYSYIAEALSTRSLKKMAKLAEVDFDCKDCNVQWEAFVGRLVEMLETMPAWTEGEEMVEGDDRMI